MSITDALQAFLMLVAALILPIVALNEVGGFQALVAAADESAYWQWSGANSGWFALGFVIGMVSIGFGPIGQPHLLTRIMAMADEQAIGRARSIAIGWFVLVLGGMYVLGVCGHVLGMSVDNGEQVFFVLAEDLLPAVVTGVLIAAVLSAIMSTADSQLLVAGSALHHDMKVKMTRHAASSARVADLLVATAAILLAALIPESIFSRVLFAWTALGAAFGPIAIARFLDWQLKVWAIPISMGLGFVLTVIFYLLPNGPGDVWERAVPFVTAFVTLFMARTSIGKDSD